MKSKEEWLREHKKLSGKMCKHGVPVEHNCLACWTKIILGR